MIEVSACGKSGAGASRDGKVYVWGENTGKKFGLENEKELYAVEITKVQNQDKEEIALPKLENVAVGEKHSTISDVDGYVYTSRTKRKRRTWNRGQRAKGDIY